MTDRTITESELIEAVKRLGYAWFNFSNPDHARKLVDDIVAHREQEWKPWDVVRSARGNYYRRTNTGEWYRFGDSSAYKHDFPTRPLTFICNEGNHF